jgi:hypothetical protein
MAPTATSPAATMPPPRAPHCRSQQRGAAHTNYAAKQQSLKMHLFEIKRQKQIKRSAAPAAEAET